MNIVFHVHYSLYHFLAFLGSHFFLLFINYYCKLIPCISHVSCPLSCQIKSIVKNNKQVYIFIYFMCRIERKRVCICVSLFIY